MQGERESEPGVELELDDELLDELADRVLTKLEERAQST
jgi:hypothetical protein